MKKMAAVAMAAILGTALMGCANVVNASPKLMSEQSAEVGGTISFATDTVNCEGEGITATGSDVKITKGGVYTVSGTCADGSITVDAADSDVELILKGADITNADGAAVLFLNANNAYLNLSGNNKLSDGGSSEYDGALYGVVSYSIGGDGALEVVGTNQEGIASEMHLTIEDGDITINSKDDGINANNDGVSQITINGGTLNITAGGDGIDSNGSVEINGGEVITCAAVSDMSSGIDADGEVTINGGTVFASGQSASAVTGGDQKYLIYNFSEVQKAGSKVTFTNGTETIFVIQPTSDFAAVTFSSEKIEEGVDYTVSVDGTEDGTINTEDSKSANVFGQHGGKKGRGEFDGERPQLPNDEMRDLDDERMYGRGGHRGDFDGRFKGYFDGERPDTSGSESQPLPDNNEKDATTNDSASSEPSADADSQSKTRPTLPNENNQNADDSQNQQQAPNTKPDATSGATQKAQ